MMNKVVIIGCGNVGMSYAYALLNQQTNINSLILIDINEEKAQGEVMDLNHCLALAPSKMNIRLGSYQDCKDATIICIAAGANQKKDETRLDLIHKNKEVFKTIIEQVMKSGFHGIFLVATNPLDIMTYITWKYSGLDHHKIIGSGTSLDTARLRYIIGNKLQINPKNVHAYVIGEHGDSEFVPWTHATVGLQSISDYLNNEELEHIYHEVKNSAYEIIKRKGATYYGIGMCLASITKAILNNENSIISVSTYQEADQIFIGMPAIINYEGIKKVVPLDLIQEEKEKLAASIDIIKKVIATL